MYVSTELVTRSSGSNQDQSRSLRTQTGQSETDPVHLQTGASASPLYLMTRVCPCREEWASPQPSLQEYKSTRWLLWSTNTHRVQQRWRLEWTALSDEHRRTWTPRLWSTNRISALPSEPLRSFVLAEPAASHAHLPHFQLSGFLIMWPWTAELTEAAKMWASEPWGFHWTVPTSHLLWRPILRGGSDGASRSTK